jgi:hypothetical protein
MKNAVFLDVTPCGSLCVLRLLATANVVPSSHILLTLMMKVIGSSENVYSYKIHTA